MPGPLPTWPHMGWIDHTTLCLIHYLPAISTPWGQMHIMQAAGAAAAWLRPQPELVQYFISSENETVLFYLMIFFHNFPPTVSLGLGNVNNGNPTQVPPSADWAPGQAAHLLREQADGPVRHSEGRPQGGGRRLQLCRHRVAHAADGAPNSVDHRRRLRALARRHPVKITTSLSSVTALPP